MSSGKAVARPASGKSATKETTLNTLKAQQQKKKGEAFIHTKKHQARRKAGTSTTTPTRGFSPETGRFQDLATKNAQHVIGQTDVTGPPLATDLAKGTICVKKRKVPGVSRIATAGNQVWCVSQNSLKVLTQNARDIKSFDNIPFLTLCGVSNRMFASTSAGQIIAYDTRTVREVFRVEASSQPVTALAIYGDKLISATVGELRLWDCETGHSVARIDASHAVINCLVVHHNILFAGCHDGRIISYDLDTKAFNGDVSIAPQSTQTNQPQSPVPEILSLAVVEEQLWAGASDSNIYIWALGENKPPLKLGRHNKGVTVLASVGNKVWSGSLDSKIGLWTTKGELVGVLPCAQSGGITDIAVVGLFVWIATNDEMLRVFIAQGLVENAQEDLNRFSLSSVGELESLFTSTMQENEHLCLLLRSLKTQLMRSKSWTDRALPTDYHDPRSAKENITLEDLIERLRELEAMWSHQRQVVLDNWDLPAQTKELQAELRQNDFVKKGLWEVRGLFAEVEKKLMAEKDRISDELELQTRAHEQNEEELKRLTKQHAEEKDAADAKIKSLTAECDTLHKSVDGKMKEIKDLETQLATLTKQKKDVEALIAKKNADLAMNEKMTNELSDLKRKLTKEISDQEAQLLVLADQKKESEASLEKQKSQQEGLDKQLKDLTAENTVLETKEKAQEKELNEAKQKKTELQAQITAKQKELDKIEQDIKAKCCLVV